MQHMSRTLPIMGAQFKQNAARNVKRFEGLLLSEKPVRYSNRPSSSSRVRIDHATDNTFFHFLSPGRSFPPRRDTRLPSENPSRTL